MKSQYERPICRQKGQYRSLLGLLYKNEQVELVSSDYNRLKLLQALDESLNCRIKCLIFADVHSNSMMGRN